MKCLYLLIILCVLFSGCSKQESSNSQQDTISGKLIIFHAGSLAVPFVEIIKEFNILYPDVVVQKEIAGSRTCARKISELNKPCDVFASADYTVIDSLLIPEHTEWNIKFATNEMAIVYNEKSSYAEEISVENWYDFLQKNNVIFGRSDPDSDPCGYRAVLTIKLTEQFYNINGLSDKLLAKDVEYIRPKETDLLALLEVNEIDYIFLYKSVAVQHNLKYISLPDQVNLRSPEMSELYSKVTVNVSGSNPGETITKTGESMVYGITIPKSSPNPKAAIAFVSFVLSRENGLEILEKNGQPGIVPVLSDTFNFIPEELRKYALSP